MKPDDEMKAKKGKYSSENSRSKRLFLSLDTCTVTLYFEASSLLYRKKFFYSANKFGAHVQAEAYFNPTLTEGELYAINTDSEVK